jgi:hypothetical protein
MNKKTDSSENMDTNPQNSKPEPRTKKIVTCPLCGMSFDANNQQACKACKKKHNCPMVSCPNCYHEFLPSK